MQLPSIKQLGKAARHALRRVFNPASPRLPGNYYDTLVIVRVDTSDGGNVLGIANSYLQGVAQSLLKVYPHALRCEIQGFKKKRAEYRIHFQIRFTNEFHAQQLEVAGQSLKGWFELGEMQGLWTCLVYHGGIDLLAGYDRSRARGATLVTGNPVIASSSKTVASKAIKKSAPEMLSAPEVLSARVEHHDPWEGSSRSHAIKQATGDLGSEDIHIRDFGVEGTQDFTGGFQEKEDSIEMEDMSEVRRGKQRER